MSFYDTFESLCAQKGVTPTQVARDNGIKQSVVAMWKKRGSTPKAETVQKLADYFCVSVDYLLGIKPLAPKKIAVTETRSMTLNSSNQEFFAFNDFLEEIGYKAVFELDTFENINPEMKWTLYDNRSNKRYFISTDRLQKLSDSITSFTKYQISELISELDEVPRPPPTTSKNPSEELQKDK